MAIKIEETIVNGGFPPSTETKKRKKSSSVANETKPSTKKIKSETNSSSATSKPKPKKTTAATKKSNGNATVKKETKVSNGKTTIKKETKTSKPASAKKSIKDESESLNEDLDEDDTEAEYKWWEQAGENDGSIKWTTLSHNGVLFPPPYEPLPKNAHLVYDGKFVKLPVEAEEVAGFFGAMIETDHAKNPTFQKNFFKDFCAVLKESKQDAINFKTKEVVKIESFEKCDFSVLHKHFETQREMKKKLPPSEKKRIKAEKDEFEAPYKVCILDGHKENVGNFRIEPPSLFRGRGEHPKTGKLKRRVQPEEVTINIGKEAEVPKPPEGHQWASVQHDNTVAWLATWKENINGNVKYVMLSANSSLKGLSDLKKFEKARELKNHIDRIRKDYQKDLRSKSMLDRQRATATYLIDKLALRAGGEKGEDEADTVGCCSLRYEHVSLVPPNIVVFDFLGKDSVPYHNEQEVDPQVFKNIMIFKKKPKTVGDQIFDRLDPSILNKHFQGYMKGLTAKVFRTYNATHTMQQQMDIIPNEGTINEKIVRYNAANRQVAILCNHQKAIGKTHDAAMEKIDDRINVLKWKRTILKKYIGVLDPEMKNKKAGKAFFADTKEFSSAELTTIVKKHFHAERERTTLRYERLAEREKYGEEIPDDKKFTKADLKEKLAKFVEQEKEAISVIKQAKPEVKAGQTVEKLKAQVEKLDTQIKNMELAKQDKQDNSQVALGTSKLNYIDPRLTVMFAKKYDVPIDKLFGKSMREKFKWAIESADENWRF